LSLAPSKVTWQPLETHRGGGGGAGGGGGDGGGGEGGYDGGVTGGSAGGGGVCGSVIGSRGGEDGGGGATVRGTEAPSEVVTAGGCETTSVSKAFEISSNVPLKSVSAAAATLTATVALSDDPSGMTISTPTSMLPAAMRKMM